MPVLVEFPNPVPLPPNAPLVLVAPPKRPPPLVVAAVPKAGLFCPKVEVVLVFDPKPVKPDVAVLPPNSDPPVVLVLFPNVLPVFELPKPPNVEPVFCWPLPKNDMAIDARGGAKGEKVRSCA